MDRPIRYVSPGARPPHTGTASQPYGSIEQALATAAPTTVVALSAGTYRENVRLGEGVSLHGRCPTQTVILSSDPAVNEGVITAVGRHVEVRNLGIGRSERPGLAVANGGAAIARDLIIEGALIGGILVSAGGELEGEDLVVRSTRAHETGVHGRGLQIDGDGVAAFQRLVLDESREMGIMNAGQLVLEDLVIRDTRSAGDGTAGIGIISREGARTTIRRALLESNLQAGVVAESRAHVLLEDVVVRDTGAPPTGDGVGAALIVNGATASARRALFARSLGVGILVQAAGSRATLDQVVVNGVPATREGSFGRGIEIVLGGVLEARGVLVEDTREAGVTLAMRDSEALLEDVVIRDVRGRPADGLFGRGLNVQTNANVQAARLMIDRTRATGVFVGDHSSATLVDARVRRTEANADGMFGRGLSIQQDSLVSAERLVLDENTDVGLHLRDGGRLIARDLVVRGTRPNVVDSLFGRGVSVESGAQLEASRTLVENNHEIGVAALGEGTRVHLTDVRVLDTAEVACSDTTCPDMPGGFGVGAFGGAALDMSGLTIAGAPLCGVHLSDGGAIDLHDGEVTGCGIGACVEDAYDVSRLSDDVSYHDNGRNLETTELPVPAPAPPLPGS